MRQYFGYRVSIVFIGCLIHAVLFAGISIKGELTHQQDASIGGSYQGTIVVGNDGNEPVALSIYQKDYLFFSDGRVLYNDPGSALRSNAKWIDFSPKSIIVAPHANAEINYQVSVPMVDTLNGTYWSLIMIEPEESNPEDTIHSIPQEVKTVLRYGIQLITEIGPESSCQIRFSNPVFERIETKRIFHVDLENIGVNVAQSEVWLELYDEAGNRIQLFEKEKSRIYPGTSIRVRYDLSNIPEGLYQALMIADCGDDDIFGARYSIQVTTQ